MGFTLQSFPLRSSISFSSNSITMKGDIMLQLLAVSLRKPFNTPWVPLTKPLSENNADCRWAPYPRRYLWFHVSSPGPKGLGNSTWPLQNLFPLLFHGPAYVRKRHWVHEITPVPLIPRGSRVLPGYPKTPRLLTGGHYRDDTFGSTYPRLDPKVWAI